MRAANTFLSRMPTENRLARCYPVRDAGLAFSTLRGWRYLMMSCIAQFWKIPLIDVWSLWGLYNSFSTEIPDKKVFFMHYVVLT